MLIDKTTAAAVLLLIVFLLYNYLIFELVDHFLEKPRLKRVYRIPVGIANTAIAACATLLPLSTSLLGYCAIWLVLFVDFCVFYRDKPLRSLFCASACALHIMAIRSICVACFSLIMGCSIYEIANDGFYLVLSMMLSFVFINIAVLLVLKLIPAKSIKIITQHNDQLYFMTAWIAIFNVYLLSNAQIYSQPQDYPHLTENQIVSSVAILFGLYVVLFFAMRMGTLLGYKEKSEKLQQVVYNEKQYRDSVFSDAIMAYEFNFTLNRVVKGFEAYRDQLGDSIYNYSDMLSFMGTNLICSEDANKFIEYAASANLIGEFMQGKSETSIEYRRLLPNGETVWVRATNNVVRDALTGELKGFAYEKNIDKEKKQQLELKYKAERDSLTGLYNKGMTKKLITEQLLFSHSAGGALLIIDVDNFKTINDHLGHTYGDAVLCELSEKLHEVFRGDDVVGRIGGDEFIVFVKNITSQKTITGKAQEVCKKFYKTYKGDNQAECTVSGSIGVALFPQDGISFEDLYRNADSALYMAKNDGKNTFRLYQGEVFAGYETNRTAIDFQGIAGQKSFRRNRIEYVFKILYDSDSPLTAIRSVLELMTSHFHFDRGYIFETSKDGRTTSNTFEWCAEDVLPMIDTLQNVPIEAVATANNSFEDKGMFIVTGLDMLQEVERAVLEPQGIKSMFQFGIFDKDDLLGFIGFDNCRDEIPPNNEQIDEMLTICNMLATFFVKQRITENSARYITALSAVMNKLESFTYIIDKSTFELLFMNDKTAQVTGQRGALDCARGGEKCYEFFRGNTAPCENCPVQELSSDPKSKAVREIFSGKYQIWIETTASYIEWLDDQQTCIIKCMDITKG